MILFLTVPSAYPAGLAGLEFAPYTTRPGAIFDYGLEPSIVGKSVENTLWHPNHYQNNKWFSLQVFKKTFFKACQWFLQRVAIFWASTPPPPPHQAET